MHSTGAKKTQSQTMLLSVNTEKTGAHLKRLLSGHGYTVKEIKTITGVTSEQAIYKWYRGESTPSLENLLILSRVLRMTVNELIVTDEAPMLEE